MAKVLQKRNTFFYALNEHPYRNWSS